MRFFIPEKFTETEIVVINSRFIASAGPVLSTDDAKQFIRSKYNKLQIQALRVDQLQTALSQSGLSLGNLMHVLILRFAV